MANYSIHLNKSQYLLNSISSCWFARPLTSSSLGAVTHFYFGRLVFFFLVKNKISCQKWVRKTDNKISKWDRVKRKQRRNLIHMRIDVLRNLSRKYYSCVTIKKDRYKFSFITEMQKHFFTYWKAHLERVFWLCRMLSITLDIWLDQSEQSL